MKEVSPPVGVYNDPRCALELLKKTTGVKKSAFGISAVRFTHHHKKGSTPGQSVVCANLLYAVLFWRYLALLCLRKRQKVVALHRFLIHK